MAETQEEKAQAKVYAGRNKLDKYKGQTEDKSR